MKHRLAIALVFLILIFACPLICPAGQTLTITDMNGRTVETPADPDRIICIGPGALRLIVYLQAETKVVGVENMEKMTPAGRPYWIAHPELSKLPLCGPGGAAAINKKPDLESVLSVKPRVIFATYMDTALADEVQKTLGIPVVILTYGSLATFDERVYDSIRLAGRILNREKRAENIMAYIESLKKDMQDRTGAISKNLRPRVYVGGVGHRGSHGIESSEKSYIPFQWVNVDNIAEKAETAVGSHTTMDKESLLKQNPDIIFIDGGGLILVEEDYKKKTEFYSALKAFRSGQVYTLLPFNHYTTNIETALADAYAVGKTIYPDRFKDMDPERKADEIYSFFVGKTVYRDMKESFGAIGGKALFLK